MDWTTAQALGPFRMTGDLPCGFCGFCACQCAFTGIATGTWFALVQCLQHVQCEFTGIATGTWFGLAQCLQHVQLCGDRGHFILQPTTLLYCRCIFLKSQFASTCKYALSPCTHPRATSVHKQHGSPVYTAPDAVCALDVLAELMPKENTKNARRLCNGSHQINGHQFSCDAESSPRACTRFASSCDAHVRVKLDLVTHHVRVKLDLVTHHVCQDKRPTYVRKAAKTPSNST